MLTMICLAAVAAGQTTALLPSPKARFVDPTTGGPLASGKVYTYQAGTTTPLVTYKNSVGGVANENTNPVILNAAGEADIWLGNSGPYKIELRNSANTILWTVDQVSDWGQILRRDLADSSNTSMGDALVSVKQPLTGAVARTQHAKNADMISVKDFGAIGDDTTDDWAALQAAFDTVNTSQGGSIYFPCGTYKITKMLKLSTNAIVQGCGVNTGATIHFVPDENVEVAIAHFTPKPVGERRRYGGLRDIQLSGPGYTAQGTVGVYVGGDPSSVIAPADAEGNHIVYDRLVVKGFETGMKLGNHAYNNEHFSCEWKDNSVGILLPQGVIDSGAMMNFHGGIFLSNRKAGVEQQQGHMQAVFYSTAFELNRRGYAGSTISAEFYGVNFETYAEAGCTDDQCGPFIENLGATTGYIRVQITGGTAIYGTIPENPTGGTYTKMFSLTGSIINLAVDGLQVYSTKPLERVFYVKASENSFSSIYVNNVKGDEPNSITEVVNSDVGTENILFATKGNAAHLPQRYCFGCTNPPTNARITVAPGSLQFPPSGVNLLPSSHPTSRRASISIGNWVWLQDALGDGTNNLQLYDSASATAPFFFSNTRHACIGENCAASQDTLQVATFASGAATRFGVTATTTQGTTPMQVWRSSGGATLSSVDADGVATLRQKTVATLPAAASSTGKLIYVTDGAPGTTPCTGSSTGALAVSNGAQWSCK